MDGCRNNVGYRLRFAGAWRPLHDNVSFFAYGLDNECLRTVGVHDLDKICGLEESIEDESGSIGNGSSAKPSVSRPRNSG